MPKYQNAQSDCYYIEITCAEVNVLDFLVPAQAEMTCNQTRNYIFHGTCFLWKINLDCLDNQDVPKIKLYDQFCGAKE